MEAQTPNPEPIKSKSKLWLIPIVAGVILLLASVAWYFYGPYAKVGNQTIWKPEFKKILPRYTKYFEIAGDETSKKDPDKATLNLLAFDMLLTQEAKKHNVQPSQDYVDDNMKAVAEGTPPEKVKKLYEYAPDLLKKEFTRTNLKEQLEMKVLKRRSGWAMTITYPYSSDLTDAQKTTSLAHAKAVADRIHSDIEKSGFDSVVSNLSGYQDSKNKITATANQTSFFPGTSGQETELLKLIFSTAVGSTTNPLQELNGYSVYKIDSASAGTHNTWEDYIISNVRKI